MQEKHAILLDPKPSTQQTHGLQDSPESSTASADRTVGISSRATGQNFLRVSGFRVLEGIDRFFFVFAVRLCDLNRGLLRPSIQGATPQTVGLWIPR